MSGESTSTQNQNSMNGTSFSPKVLAQGQSLYEKLAANPSWTGYSGPTSASFGPGSTAATNYATGALGTPNAQQVGAGSTLQSIIDSINPKAGPGQYMDPYVEATLSPVLRNIELARNQQNQGTGAAATLAGAYGGTGHGVATALNNRYADQAVTDATGQAYSSAYNSAVQQQQQSLLTLLNAAGGQTSLGASENANNLSLASLLAGIGAQQQQAGQTGVQNEIALNQQNQSMPLSQGATLASILASIPKNSRTWGNTTSTTSQPNNAGMSLLGSLLGNSSLGLGNIMGGVGVGAAAAGGLGSLGDLALIGSVGLLSDVRAKEDIAPIGRLNDGQNIYSYRYKGDRTPRIGLMAQEVERVRPDAVHDTPVGLKVVNYAKATERARHIGLAQLLDSLAA